jgi:hypothetical protein
MLWTIAVILIALWLLGLVSSYTITSCWCSPLSWCGSRSFRDDDWCKKPLWATEAHTPKGRCNN